MAVILTPPYLEFADLNGNPLSGGKLYTYEAGTTTPKATYTDNTEATPLSNPVVLDSAGRAVVWGNGSYKFVVTDSADNIIKTVDNVTTFNVSSGSVIPSASAGGTVNAITADYSPNITLDDKVIVSFVSSGANTSTTPTFSPDGNTARTIVKNGGQALVAGDIGPVGYVALLQYNLANTRWELLNPVYGPQVSVIERIVFSQVSVTCTISNASPAVVTVTTATLPQNNSPVRFTTTGALPTGLSTGTTYWVINASGSTYNVSATKGGSAIATSSAGSGTHTVNSAPYEKNTNLLYADLEALGSGGGGGGTSAAGGAGNTSSIGSLVSATGGAAGTGVTTGAATGNAGGLGGVGASNEIKVNGQAGSNGSATTTFANGGHGGSTIYGAGGRGGFTGGASNTGTAGLGFGSGGGGAAQITTTICGASGGAAGGYDKRTVAASAIASSETVTVGVAGTAGAVNGSAGANGVCIVTEYRSA